MTTISTALKSHCNYFALFDLPIDFDVDPACLIGRYRALVDGDAQSVARPPTLSRAHPIDQTPLEIERAYRTLADPLARAAHLIELLDPHAEHPEEVREIAAFLVTQMELRESLDEATKGPDPSTSVATVLTRLAEEGASLAKELQAVLADPSPRTLAAAREILRRLELVGTCRRDAQDRRAAWSAES